MALVTLRVIDGPQRGTIYHQLSLPVTIGREEGNVVRLPDERVSRYHIKIHERDRTILLADLQSTNGTRVNGEVVQSWLLRPGDLIFVGRSVLLFGSADEIAGRLHRIREAGSESRVPFEILDDMRPAMAQALMVGRSPASSVSGVVSVGKSGGSSGESVPLIDRELFRAIPPDDIALLYQLAPPTLPSKLTARQQAQLGELLQYLQLRLRYLVASVKINRSDKIDDKASENQIDSDQTDAAAVRESVTLDLAEWQNLIDLYGRIALYLHVLNEQRQ